MKFADGSRTNYMQGPSQLSTPLYSQLILCNYAVTNGLGGGAQTEFTSGKGNPRYATAPAAVLRSPCCILFAQTDVDHTQSCGSQLLRDWPGEDGFLCFDVTQQTAVEKIVCVDVVAGFTISPQRPAVASKSTHCHNRYRL